MNWLAWSTIFVVSPMRASAWWALSALVRVIEAISSREAEVSSNEAACSEAPWERDWDTPEMRPAALLTSSEAQDSPEATRCRRPRWRRGMINRPKNMRTMGIMTRRKEFRKEASSSMASLRYTPVPTIQPQGAKAWT